MDDNPVYLVQNPAFGARLLWQFSEGYQAEMVDRGPHFLQMFLVLPLILHEPTLKLISSTNLPSGLSKLREKLTLEREQLLEVHERAARLRGLTLESLVVAENANVIGVDYDKATIWAKEVEFPKPTERNKPHLRAAAKTGRWFARMPTSDTFSILQVSV